MKRLYATVALMITLACGASTGQAHATGYAAMQLAKAKVVVTPTADARTINIHLQQQPGSKSLIRIRDERNQTVYLQPVRKTGFTERVNFRNMAPGNYVLEVTNGNEVSRQVLSIN